MTKIDIFSGFLGAGKTTLIKKLIAEAYQGEKLVLIENEFGEIGIDGAFMQDAGIQVNEMNSGCICCSLVGDFGRALKKVLSEYAPDRILIEPSGVGKLSDVIGAVERIEGAQPQRGHHHHPLDRALRQDHPVRHGAQGHPGGGPAGAFRDGPQGGRGGARAPSPPSSP